MSTPPRPKPTPAPPVPADELVAPVDAPNAEDLDPEEDIAPNLGGEDQMQDA
jgi:hypothetical protein